mmetsp:Transcript_29599/g.85714  ORF Transcript_29599/g.85714 Transcript_29599/m.85714 type:complete len:231 (-) Transcript_29599:964-1656(-)
MGREAVFLTIYVKEAHPTDGWHVEGNVEVRHHQSLEERIDVASRFKATMDLGHMVVDAMDAGAAIKYAAWPDRLFVLDEQMTVVYVGGHGPFGYKVPDVVKFLCQRLGKDPATVLGKISHSDDMGGLSAEVDALPIYKADDLANAGFVLYHFPGCKFCERVEKVLAEKKMASCLPIRDIHDASSGQDNKQELITRGGKGQVPALLLPSGSILYDSNMIIRFINTHFTTQG